MPESFTPANRLNLEPIRSPKGAEMEIVKGNAHDILCHEFIDLNSDIGSMKLREKQPISRVQIKPIAAPSIVLFGEMEGASEFFPKNFPPKKAIESLIHIKPKIINKIDKLSILE